MLCGVECLGFKRGECCVSGLSVLCRSRVLKELDNGVGLVENNVVEKLGMPHLLQVHETLLPTSPV